MDWGIRALGVIFLAAGLGLMRQAWLNWRLERACRRLFASSSTERAAEGVQAANAMLVAVAGAFLAVLSPLAVVVFLMCWAVQAAYLLWAARWFRPTLPLAARGRSRSIDAFAGFTVVTALVLCLPAVGLLR